MKKILLTGLATGVILSPISYGAMDVTTSMVVSWFFYGLFQAAIAGITFARINP